MARLRSEHVALHLRRFRARRRSARVVAELFAPASEAFLRSAAPMLPALAVDLGCGPGHTTRLVQQIVKAGRTMGLDRSTSFIATASATPTPGVHSSRTLRRRCPCPIAPPDLIFARLLLAHLPDHGSIAARMFAMNLQVLSDTGETATRPDLSDALWALAADTSAAPVVWRMRQIAFERRSTS